MKPLKTALEAGIIPSDSSLTGGSWHMPQADLLVLMGLGGLFAVLGAVALLWGRKEEKDYYRAISARSDVREYMERVPERPEPGGLKAGGIIAIVIGLFMLLMGGAFWLWG